MIPNMDPKTCPWAHAAPQRVCVTASRASGITIVWYAIVVVAAAIVLISGLLALPAGMATVLPLIAACGVFGGLGNHMLNGNAKECNVIRSLVLGVSSALILPVGLSLIGSSALKDAIAYMVKESSKPDSAGLTSVIVLDAWCIVVAVFSTTFLDIASGYLAKLRISQQVDISKKQIEAEDMKEDAVEEALVNRPAIASQMEHAILKTLSIQDAVLWAIDLDRDTNTKASICEYLAAEGVTGAGDDAVQTALNALRGKGLVRGRRGRRAKSGTGATGNWILTDAGYEWLRQARSSAVPTTQNA